MLNINNFSLSFIQNNEKKVVLKDINFHVSEGEIVGIVGESGSGKSVTALSIMKLLNNIKLQTWSGNIIYNSKDKTYNNINLTTLSEKKLQHIRGNKIAMIFQEPMTSLNPSVKCGKQIEESIVFHKKFTKKDAKKEVINLLSKVMLPNPEKIYNLYPHEISGGQKQRIMIAMAICCDPDILIADEPTTALDVTVQKGIIKLLKELQREKQMSIIFITHDLGVVAEIADRVLVFYNGSIVETGSVDNIFNFPQHPYTQGLLACRPPVNIKYIHLPTVRDFMQNIECHEKTKKNIKYWFDKDNIISQEEIDEFHKKIYSKPPLLKIENLSKSYSYKNSLFSKKKYIFAVNNINFEIYEGETLGLAGESGCGKTTLGRAILNLIRPTTGKVVFENKIVNELPKKELKLLRKDMQIILQDPYSSLNQLITIEETIMEPLIVHNLFKTFKERKNRVIELLEKVGLDKAHLSRYPHEFSGGQRQRIAIARALAVEPKFIICDESVSALDVSIQAQVLNLLNELKKEMNLTYLFISHDLSVVKYMSDRIAIMQKGELVELADADTIFNNPKSNYTKTLINSIPNKNFIIQ